MLFKRKPYTSDRIQHKEGSYQLMNFRREKTRIKICGVRDAVTASIACNAGADAIGLVFVKKSPRSIDRDTASEISAGLPPFVDSVGLFVDTPPESIREIATQVGLRTIQLHGKEGREEFQELAEFKLIKSIAFDEHKIEALGDLYEIRELSGVIVDAPPKGGLTGGTGQVLDWDQVAAADDLPVAKPLILAGGLTPENVGEAIRKVRPYAVDVSSGVESSRGVKDHGLIRAFCDAVREADASLANG